MPEKSRRQAALLRIVQRRVVRNQDEMVKHLRMVGFPVTQASVSRDARELGLIKLRGRYAMPTAVSGKPGDGTAQTNELITAIEPVGANLVICRTAVGAASAVAVQLDRRPAPDIAGTVAGDDTVFVAVRSRSAQGRVVAMLRSMLPPR